MSKTFWQILQTAWRKANQPIPGTEEDRSKWVIVEGRYPSLQMAPMKVKVIFIVLCILLGLCTYLLTHFLFPALSNVIKSNMCVEGWFGKSLGSQISILWLLLLFLIISGISAYGFVRGCRTWRQRRDIP
ncbi:MAG: hypothetical protein LBB65_08045, partial [Burkholderiales bacterium]|nr:hypothetical protein [Burkholderiales bacterium]